MLYTLTSDYNNGHDFTINTTQTTRLDKRNSYEVALISAMINYGWYNISAAIGNNIIKYRVSNVAAWETLTIPDSTCDINQLNAQLKAKMLLDGNYDAGADARAGYISDDLYYITLGANYATGRVRITISNNYQLDLSQSTIWEVLGFNEGTVLATNAVHEGPDVPDFNRDVNQIHIRCDLVANNSSFVNGKSEPVLYGFNPVGTPYAFMNIVPSSHIYLPMNTTSIDAINIKITDQAGNLLLLGGEKTTILINIRPITV